MTDLSILLHAAARGARIQVFNVLGAWVTVELVVVANKHVPEYRVHPSDEHLMWGPLSRQYYERALYGDVSKKGAAQDATEFYVEAMTGIVTADIPVGQYVQHYCNADDPTRRMILLTIALALRDEGM